MIARHWLDNRGRVHWEESAFLERGPLALLLQGLERETDGWDCIV